MAKKDDDDDDIWDGFGTFLQWVVNLVYVVVAITVIILCFLAVMASSESFATIVGRRTIELCSRGCEGESATVIAARADALRARQKIGLN
jgi:dolichol kinase